VESGYCAATRYAKKEGDKCEHEKLVDMLKMFGHAVHLRPLPLGYAGTIYIVNAARPGTAKNSGQRSSKKLHMYTIPTQHHQGKEIPNGGYALQARGTRRNNGAG